MSQKVYLSCAPPDELFEENRFNLQSTLERWAEHFQVLYSRETTVTNIALENTLPLPAMDELDVPHAMDELSKAVECLASGKASGSANISLKSSRPGRRAPFYSICMRSCCSAGRKGQCPRACAIPRSSRFTSKRGPE